MKPKSILAAEIACLPFLPTETTGPPVIYGSTEKEKGGMAEIARERSTGCPSVSTGQSCSSLDDDREGHEPILPLVRYLPRLITTRASRVMSPLLATIAAVRSGFSLTVETSHLHTSQNPLQSRQDSPPLSTP
ncbi:hypothetical protein LIA77_08253 [Sarocladium implicatum]|nr:hypothetical protein LIA77_08253 [Sarocladium implicatum]